MPTEKVMEKFNDLIKNILKLLEVKKQCERLEYEIKVQKQKSEGAPPVLSRASSAGSMHEKVFY